MKTLFRMMALFLMLFSFAACSDDDDEVLTSLEVTPANLDGTWKLTERNGAALAEGTYCYITFSRRDKTFKMYDNIGTMYADLKTGEFNVEKNNQYGYVISGKYDFGNGSWNDSYIVTDLLTTGTMTWTGKKNPDDVQKFERCPEVPSDILDEVGE